MPKKYFETQRLLNEEQDETLEAIRKFGLLKLGLLIFGRLHSCECREINSDTAKDSLASLSSVALSL
jgi:hypothetical protein